MIDVGPLGNYSVKYNGTEPQGFLTPVNKLNNHIFGLATLPLCLKTEPIGKVNGLFFDGEVFDHLTTDAMGSDDEEEESDPEDDSVNHKTVLKLFSGVTLKCDTLVDQH